ncbi:MAG: hypothetical protein PHZ26_02760 [Candidatus Gracilibacteria bacterium]|nr:hypothetical protein [Candidatus Gracilibacteria bacterium]MDD2908653.1 hypothetical protein [Candidatus Gracilibacteria bacterium]
MYKIIVTKNFIDKINSFTVYMKDYYRNIFSNTGIYSEKDIIKAYIKTYEELQDSIYLEVEKIANNGLIGRKIIKSEGNLEISIITFQKRSYSISFYSIKDSVNKVIEIYDIIIKT